MRKFSWKVGAMSALLFVTLGMSVTSAQEELKFTLSPEKSVEQSTGFYRETVSGGEKRNYNFYLENIKNDPIDVWVYPADVVPGENGGKLFTKRDEELTRAATWVTPRYSYKVSLKAKEKRKLTYSVKVPKDIVPGQHPIVIVAEEVVDPKDKENPTQSATQAVVVIDKAQKLGVQIALESRLDQAKHEMTIDDFQHYYIANGYTQMMIKLSNTGTMVEQPNGIIEVRDSKGNGIFSESYNNAPKERSIYGSTTADMVYTIQNKVLFPGEYSVYFEANYSGKKVSRTFKFTVTKEQSDKSQEELSYAGILQGGSFGDWIKGNALLAGVIGGALLLFVLGFFFLLFILIKRKKEDKDKKFNSKFSTPRGQH